MYMQPQLLIIDGDRYFTDDLERALDDCAIDVTIMPDGNRGLAHALVYPPDMIILDWQLRYRSGFLVIEYLREHSDFDGSITAVSNNQSPRYMAYGTMLGVDRYFSKPANVRALKEHILESIAPAPMAV